MLQRLLSISLIFIIATSFAGCQSGFSPTEPATAPSLSPDSQSAPSRYLWGLYTISVDSSHTRFTITPVRSADIHWNILRWLEQSPCANCLKIKNLHPSGYGTVLADIEIKHPFSNPNLTGFDVRGIALFNGSHTFPASGLTMPDRTLGDGELVNADGYTTLYNITTIGSGPDGMQGYIDGKLASDTPPNALLNGFKRFISDDPANTRNAFYAGDTVTVTCELAMQSGPFIFGYAVDASWAQPISKPVDDPITDFPVSANCPEPWRIDVTENPIGEGLTNKGGEVTLVIYVYDFQGKDSYHAPVVECPELFEGSKICIFKKDFSN